MPKPNGKNAMSLRDAALKVRENAYAPYSGFKVGAAVRTTAGEVFTDATWKTRPTRKAPVPKRAQSRHGAAGATEIAEAYVVADAPLPVSPCGGCRQKLAEFGAEDVPVILATLDGKEVATTVGALLPGGFSADYMEG